MALNIKNLVVERLAQEVADLAGETKTEAIRRALEERKRQLSFQFRDMDPTRRLVEFLETEIWPRVPRRELGRRMSKREREEILGYGRGGV